MTTINWDCLNAYVDRELDAADAAEIAAAIARDPQLAAKVATLSRLKAEASALPPPQDGPPIPTRAIGSRVSRYALALAASIALIVLVGATAWIARAPAADPVADSVAAQQGWLSGASAEASVGQIQVSVATAAGNGLPDLSAAALRLAYLAAEPGAEGRRGVFAGYVGPNGCRVGLWIGPSDEALPVPAAHDVGAVRVRAWSQGGRAFALMSKSMAIERLDRLGDVVADLTRSRNGLDDRLRLALQGAARAGAPCVG